MRLLSLSLLASASALSVSHARVGRIQMMAEKLVIWVNIATQKKPVNSARAHID